MYSRVFFLVIDMFNVSFSNVRFLMIALAYAVPTGVLAGWSGVLDMVLTPAKVSQVWHKCTHRITYCLCTSFSKVKYLKAFSKRLFPQISFFFPVPFC